MDREICERGFPESSVGQESTWNAGDPSLIPGSGRSTGEGMVYPLQHSWVSLVVQLVKNLFAILETWVQSLDWEDPLEMGKAPYSSILAWRIPWTGILMGWQRARHFSLSLLRLSWVKKIPWRRDRLPTPVFLGFPCGSAGKESTCNAGDLGSIPGLGRCPGEGKGYPLHCLGLENSMDCTVHWVTKSWTQLNDFHTQMMLKSSKHLMLSNPCFHFCSFQPNLCYWFKSLTMYLMHNTNF